MIKRETCEELRGRPIEVFTGNLFDIPCREISDDAALCRNPVVSVVTCTYNQEKYIRNTLEGILSQKTDFDFELIVGDDCSSDSTKNICVEYQRKYPSKIRVLWADVNVSKLGGNGNRCLCRCRGEFVAYCEGDDYWTDSLKLQKQVDAMRHNPTVGLCFCRARFCDETGEKMSRTWGEKLCVQPGLIAGREFFRKHAYGENGDGNCGDIGFIMTATTMIRRSLLLKLQSTYDIFKWRLAQRDTTTWLGLSAISDVYYLNDIVAVYRLNGGSTCKRNADLICIDAQIARLYWADVLSIREWRNVSYKMIFSIRANSALNGGRALRDVLRTSVKYLGREPLCSNRVKYWLFGLTRIGLLPEWALRLLNCVLKDKFSYRRGYDKS